MAHLSRPQRRFIDVVMEDMQRVGVTEQDAKDRVTWRQVIRYRDPEKVARKEDKNLFILFKL